MSAISATGQSNYVTVPNAPGHAIIGVVNNAAVDERLVSYLAPKLQLSNAEIAALKPRIRMRLRITFIDGTFQTIEYLTGSKNFIDPAFAAQATTDLSQNDFDNAVVQCDVTRVELEPGTNVEVFIPVALKQFTLNTSTNAAGGLVTGFTQTAETPPGFLSLRVDDVDADGNVTLARNIGVRDVLSPTPNVLCGSSVMVVVIGTLTVPFLTGVSQDPSYDVADTPTIAQIGGTYKFLVSVQ
ncbi:MAG: hypothetical protein HYR83_03870 [Planctomycetes bacterium]|nr:hypothetical protein [Planctomycetota bacterium]